MNNYPISQLFDIEAGVVYSIPRYQREYTWNKGQWETLFDDMQENDPGYFLGSIICINQTADTLDVQRLEVVDGQQRLTTLSLLFAALYGVLKQHEKDLDEDQRVELFNLKRKLILKKGNDQLRVIPQIQNDNQNDYRAVLSEAGVIGQCDKLAYAGNRKVFRAFRYFQSRINEVMVDDQNGQLASIMTFLDKVSQACLVKIEVASHADAYTLFESLNNRGMPLTAVDLIKNKLLARLEATEPGEVDHYFDLWNKLLGYLGDDYSIQERFFRHYYNAFRDTLNAPFREEDGRNYPLGPVAKRSNLIQIYEKLFHREARNHLRAIGAAGKLYALILSGRLDDKWALLEKPLMDLARIQGAPSYLLMLYILEKRQELDVDVDQISKIAELLVCFFVRRNLTDTPPTRDLTRLFMAVIDEIASLSGEAVVQTVEKELGEVSANVEIFRAKLEGPIYEENAGVTRFLLCALAEQGMTKETWVDLWKHERKIFVWTIEHIFPQGRNIPEAWIDMIANGDAQEAGAIQDAVVHKLGNLTISGFNSALGNKSFIHKRDRTDSKNRQVGYKNGLKLNAELATADIWRKEQIDTRTTELVRQVVSLFSMAKDRPL